MKPKLGDKDWQHPEHVKGIQSSRVFDNIIGKPLTNRRVDYYQKTGFYSSRNRYRRELRKINKVKEIMKPEKRLVYDIETQTLEER